VACAKVASNVAGTERSGRGQVMGVNGQSAGRSPREGVVARSELCWYEAKSKLKVVCLCVMCL
jgi:hypothetical protein